MVKILLRLWQWLNNSVNILKNNGLYTFKRLILCYINYISICFKQINDNLIIILLISYIKQTRLKKNIHNLTKTVIRRNRKSELKI